MKNGTSGNRLRAWREQAGLSLDEVAGLVGSSGMMISYVERGQRNLSPASKVTVSRRLGISVRELFPTPGLATRGIRQGKS
jgi:transcriptional regulator with XRE-family HTH domain